MNIAILGATGKFGRTFTAKLLTNPQYNLTLLSKSASDSFEDNYRITASNIDATNMKDLKESLKNQDIVVCAISGEDLPDIAQNLTEISITRLIVMSSVGIYNELANGNGSEFNVENDPTQLPNCKTCEIIEKSELNYTILRLGYLKYGKEDDYIITKKGEAPKGYCTTIQSVEKIILEIIEKPELYLRESISITKDMS